MDHVGAFANVLTLLGIHGTQANSATNVMMIGISIPEFFYAIWYILSEPLSVVFQSRLCKPSRRATAHHLQESHSRQRGERCTLHEVMAGLSCADVLLAHERV
jgi:hypothetical protein